MAARKGRPPVGSSQHGVPAGSPRPAPAAPANGARVTPPFTRPALAPSMIAAIVLLACVAIVDSSGFVFARWGVTVLALIVLVFSVRGKAWWAALLMAAVAVCWNPLVTVPIPGQVWAALQLVAAALFIVVGIVVKVPRESDGR
jgi:predicted membrane protein